MQKKTTFDSSLLGQDLKPICPEKPIEKSQKKKTHLRPKTGGRDPHLRMIQKLKVRQWVGIEWNFISS